MAKKKAPKKSTMSHKKSEPKNPPRGFPGMFDDKNTKARRIVRRKSKGGS